MAVPDWEKLRSEQEKIDADISRIKEEQRQSNLSRIKEIARKRGDSKTVENIDRIQRDLPEGTRVTVTEGDLTYTGVVSNLPSGKAVVGFITPQQRQQAQVIQQQRARQQREQAETKPIFTSETIEAQKKPVSLVEQKPIYDEKGNVIGVEDVTVKKSYAISKVTEADFKLQKAERSIRLQKEKEIERRENGSISNGTDNRTSLNSGSVQLDSMERLKSTTGEIKAKKNSKLNILELALSKSGETASRLEYEAQFKSKTPLERQARSFGAFGLGVVETVLYPVVKPVEFVKGTVSSFLNPVEAFKQVGEGFAIEPARTVGQVTGAVVFSEIVMSPITKSIKSKQPTVKIIAEESGSKRVTTELITSDITQTELKAILNKNKVVNLKGIAIQDIFKIEEGQYGIKAQAEVFKPNKILPSATKLAESKSVGIAVKVEGGIDTLLYSKTKLTSNPKIIYERTGIQTAELMSEPYQVFKEVSLTQDVSTPKYKFKSVSTGVTAEIGVLDLFENKNTLRKTILSESKQPIATEQYLGTERVSVSAKEFSKQFSYERYNHLAKSSATQNLLGKVSEVNINELKGGSQVLMQETKLSNAPTQQQALTSLSKNVLTDMAKQDIQNQVSFSQGASNVLKVTSQKSNVMVSNAPTQKPVELKAMSIPSKSYRFTPEYKQVESKFIMPESKTVFKVGAIESKLFKPETRSITRTGQSFKPMEALEFKQAFESKQIVEPKQAFESKQILQSKQVLKQQTIQAQTSQFRGGFSGVNIPKPKVPKVPSFPLFKKQPSQGFNVFVKKKGKEVKISDVPYTKQGALSLGARFTLNTPSATFYIKPTEFKALKEGDNIFNNVRTQFYTKTLKTGGVKYIEQNKFRINTAGELAGITRKGVEKIIWQGRQ